MVKATTAPSMDIDVIRLVFGLNGFHIKIRKSKKRPPHTVYGSHKPAAPMRPGSKKSEIKRMTNNGTRLRTVLLIPLMTFCLTKLPNMAEIIKPHITGKMILFNAMNLPS
jgi:hypothetical protein